MAGEVHGGRTVGGGSSEGELGRKYIVMLSSLQLKRA